jgi:hypothetical protein
LSGDDFRRWQVLAFVLVSAAALVIFLAATWWAGR